ncbi:MAG: universal stress protein [Halanaerobiales bacterium]|nr:universal stress protein [Halanaerobiales bacterium]
MRSKKLNFKKGIEILLNVEKYFEDNELIVNKTIQLGELVDFICSYAEEKGIDLIALTNKGLVGIIRFFIGSINKKVSSISNNQFL